MGANREGGSDLCAGRRSARNLPEADHTSAVDVRSPERGLPFEESGIAIYVTDGCTPRTRVDFFTTSVYEVYQNNPPGISFNGEEDMVARKTSRDLYHFHLWHFSSA